MLKIIKWMCSVVPFFEILHAHQNHTAVCGGCEMVSSMIFEISKFENTFKNIAKIIISIIAEN